MNKAVIIGIVAIIIGIGALAFSQSNTEVTETNTEVTSEIPVEEVIENKPKQFTIDLNEEIGMTTP